MASPFDDTGRCAPTARAQIDDQRCGTIYQRWFRPGGQQVGPRITPTTAETIGSRPDPDVILTTARAVFDFLMGTENRKFSQAPDAGDAKPQSDDADLLGRETSVEEREIAVKEREIAVKERETVVEAREVAQAERMDAAHEVRDAADERDLVSGARDVAADKRESELDLADMLNVQGGYGAHWPERRNAGSDRAHAKDDRAQSHADRIALTGGEEQDTEETRGQR